MEEATPERVPDDASRQKSRLPLPSQAARPRRVPPYGKYSGFHYYYRKSEFLSSQGCWPVLLEA